MKKGDQPPKVFDKVELQEVSRVTQPDGTTKYEIGFVDKTPKEPVWIKGTAEPSKKG